jgi:glutathione peroxidase
MFRALAIEPCFHRLAVSSVMLKPLLPYGCILVAATVCVACNHSTARETGTVASGQMERGAAQTSKPVSDPSAQMSIFEYELETIAGQPTTLAEHRGKVMLLVNVASKCGFTRQYDGLQKLWETYRDQGLVVLGFPSNDFGGQEPGTNEEIAAFCTGNFGVDFPMYGKISVKGKERHPLYGHLVERTGEEVNWNFNKFLVDREGNVVRRFNSRVEPLSEELVSAVEAQLK